jgi:HAD superfamily hydrolase (TIGR01662 family)
MPPFDTILFDLGNTLIYFDSDNPDAIYAQSDQVLLDHLGESGLHLDRKTFICELDSRQKAYDIERGTTFKEYSEEYVIKTILRDMGYPEPVPETLRRALDAKFAVSQAYWKSEIDTQDTLQTLRDEGYRIGLISNAGDDRDVQVLIDNAHLRPFLDVILVSAAEGICKPHTQLFKKALNHLDTQPSRAVMVGDYLKGDILGAHNAGMYGIWITRRAHHKYNDPHLGKIIPDATISTLSDLPPLLEKFI